MPLPICYVPHNELADLMKSHVHQTAEDSQKLYDRAITSSTQAAHEEILKSKGMCMLKVIYSI